MLTPVFSVTEFNEMVSHHLGQLGDVEVEGEISELKVSQNKWIYATIKDEGSSVNIFATIYQIHNLASLDVGMLVKVTGAPALYQKTARFSLNAHEIVPSGEGALASAYAKLKLELEKQGLFAPDRKRPLPMFPSSIGLLTGKGSEAYNDFVKVASARIGGYKILFYPVTVQGSSAVSSVIEGLRYFNDQNNVDVMVITRGGGSLEDLAPFNDERLVREIFASRLPTVAAIGHEGDVSLVELAADLRASTPSNAAELIFRARVELVRELEHNVHSMAQIIENKINIKWSIVTSNISKIERHFDLALNKATTLTTSLFHYLQNFSRQLAHEHENVGHLEEKLRALDPSSVLKRGFSILKDSSGRVLHSVVDAAVGQLVTTTLADGTILSKVTDINKEEP